MNYDETISRLKALRQEAASLPLSTSSAEFNSWEPRTRSALTRALGEKHHITQRFIKTKWTPSMYTMGDSSAFTSFFRATIPEVQGLLDAAVAEIELLAEEGPVADEAGIDHELWEHVAPEVRSQAWGKLLGKPSSSPRIESGAGRAARSPKWERTWPSPSSATTANSGWVWLTGRNKAGSCSLRASPRQSATQTPTAFKTDPITDGTRWA
nr:hypothetical protein [Mycobacteroides abscessus]